MNEFRTYHPLVNAVYFFVIIVFSAFFTHPVCLLASLFGAFSYSALLGGAKNVTRNLLYMIPTIILMTLINPLFNHEGVTVIGYLPSGNPLTMESVLYGFSASVMIICVICWFSCMSKVMTSDKFIYVFGRIAPSLALLLSMTLRFVPRLGVKMREISSARKCIGKDTSHGKFSERIKSGVAIISILVTWSLENSIDTSDSMKARGYGLGRRSSFTTYKFDKRDAFALVTVVSLALYSFVGAILGYTSFRYYPSVRGADISVFGVSVFAAYFALCLIPVIIEIREAWRWKSLRSKI